MTTKKIDKVVVRRARRSSPAGARGESGLRPGDEIRVTQLAANGMVHEMQVDLLYALHNRDRIIEAAKGLFTMAGAAAASADERIRVNGGKLYGTYLKLCTELVKADIAASREPTTQVNIQQNFGHTLSPERQAELDRLRALVKGDDDESC